MEWDSAEWGTPKDHGIDTELLEYQGFKVGDEVVALRDGDEDRHQFWFEGDEATIVGFSPPNDFRGTATILYFDGQDLMSCYDLGHFDPAED